MEPLQLTNVNFDCLCAILENLDVFGLVNMAETASKFVPVAQSVYSRRYRKKTVFVNLGRVTNGSAEYIELELELAKKICLLHHRRQSSSSPL